MTILGLALKIPRRQSMNTVVGAGTGSRNRCRRRRVALLVVVEVLDRHWDRLPFQHLEAGKEKCSGDGTDSLSIVHGKEGGGPGPSIQ